MLSLGLGACRFGFDLLPVSGTGAAEDGSYGPLDDGSVRSTADAGSQGDGGPPQPDIYTPIDAGPDSDGEVASADGAVPPGDGGTGTGTEDASTGSPDGGAEPAAELFVSFAAGAATPRCGSDGGSAFAETCPEGHAITGYRGYESTEPNLRHILRIQAICGRVVVDTSAPARVTTRDFSYLAEHGIDGDIRWERSCPEHQVVVGFSGYFDPINFVNQLTFYCAPLSVTGAANDYSFGVQAAASLAPIGSAERTLFPRVDCPQGQVATGHAGRSGFWLDAIELTCGTPSLP